MRRFAAPLWLSGVALCFPIVTFLTESGQHGAVSPVTAFAYVMFYILTVPMLGMAALWAAFIGIRKLRGHYG